MYIILNMRRLKFSGLSLAFRYQIEYDEPQSLEEFIGKFKHCYEQSKHKNKSQ